MRRRERRIRRHHLQLFNDEVNDNISIKILALQKRKLIANLMYEGMQIRYSDWRDIVDKKILKANCFIK